MHRKITTVVSCMFIWIIMNNYYSILLSLFNLKHDSISLSHRSHIDFQNRHNFKLFSAHFCIYYDSTYSIINHDDAYFKWRTSSSGSRSDLHGRGKKKRKIKKTRKRGTKAVQRKWSRVRKTTIKLFLIQRSCFMLGVRQMCQCHNYSNYKIVAFVDTCFPPIYFQASRCLFNDTAT